MRPPKETGILTVAALREKSGRILFNERQQVFALPATKTRDDVSNASFDRLLAQLRNALDHRRVVKVRLPSLDSGLIEDVETAGD